MLGLAVSWFVAGKLVAPRQSVVSDPPPDLPLEDILLPSKSGSTVSGWHIRSRSATGVVVLFHGLHGSRFSMLARAGMLFEAGYSVILVDLQAHGESPGAFVTLGHLERHDVRATVEYARSQHPAEKIAVIGQSLGGAATVLAAPLNIDALILEAVYPDLEKAIHNRTAIYLGWLGWLPAELLIAQIQPRIGATAATLSPIDDIRKVNCPVFIIAGTDDLHTTPGDSKALYSAAQEPKLLWLIEGAAHVDLLRAAPQDYAYRVLEFLEHHLGNGTGISLNQVMPSSAAAQSTG